MAAAPASTDDPESPPARPFPEVERRMRAAFPELWARYEILAEKNREEQGDPLRRRPVGSA